MKMDNDNRTEGSPAIPARLELPPALAARTVGRWVLVVFLVGMILKVTAPFTAGLLWALVFVIVAWPLFCGLRSQAGLTETKAALVLCGTATIALLLVVFPLIFELVKEIRAASSYLNTFEWQQVTAYISQVPQLELVKEFLPTSVSFSELLGPLLENSGKFFEYAGIGFQGLGRFLFNLCIGLFFSFFLFRNAEKLQRETTILVAHFVGEGSTELTRTALLSVRAAFYGTIVTAIVQGFLAGIGYWIFGVSMPALWGLITMCTSLIPFGAPLLYIPLSIHLGLGEAGLLSGALLLTWGICIVSMVDNVCRPFFMSHSTQMPLPIVLVGVVGGLLAFGMIGIFIGPPLVGVGLYLYHSFINGLRDRAALG